MTRALATEVSIATEVSADPAEVYLPVALRAIPLGRARLERSEHWKVATDSGYQLFLHCVPRPDNETGMALHLGWYETVLRGERIEAGIFYNNDSVADAELALIREFAGRHGLRVIKAWDVRAEDAESGEFEPEFASGILRKYGHGTRATVIGPNLARSFSLLATNWGKPRRARRGDA